MTSVVTPAGQTGAVSSATASSATRGALAARSSSSRCSQPAAETWPPWALGYERQHLGAGGALGRDERLRGADGDAVRRRTHDPLVAAHQLLGGEQVGEAVVERDGERVLLARALPVAARGLAGRRERRGGRGGLRLGDGERARQRLVGAGGGELARRREAPGAADAHADADPLGLLGGDVLDVAVEDRGVLGARMDVAGLGVAAAPVGLRHQVLEEVRVHHAAS
jgi:hypothetical protein